MSSTDERPDDGGETRLMELLLRYRGMRETDPAALLGSLRAEAGEFFPELVELAECEALLRTAMQEEEEIPGEVGPYRILDLLGEGAAGLVYRAVDTTSDRHVALKILRESFCTNPDALDRFRQEGSLAGRFDHEHLVKVYEAGAAGGKLYIAMELLEGGSLDRIVDDIRGKGDPEPSEAWLKILDDHGVPPLPDPAASPAEAYARRVAGLLAPVARALGTLAASGLVHRDIKPQNLVLDGEGRAKVTDFGLAKVFGNELTASLAFLGTLAYLSPEQARGDSKRVDARSDIYSLGASLYEMLTLHHPVSGDTIPETFSAIQNVRPKPISAHQKAYAAELTILVDRCLEKDPQDRYQDALALADDLERFAARGRVEIRPVPMTRRVRRAASRGRKVLVAAAASALIAVGVAMVYMHTRPGEVKIVTHPEARVSISGQEEARSPWTGKVPRGTHDIEVRRERFEVYRDRLVVKPGDTLDRSIVLTPKDSADRAAIEMIYRSLRGLAATMPPRTPTRYRGGPDPAPLTLLGPRGKVSREGLVLRVHWSGDRVPLSFGILNMNGRLVHRGHLEGDQLRLPADRFAPGQTYRIHVAREDTDDTVEAKFSVSAEPGFAERLTEYPKEDRTKPHIRILGVLSLIQAELYSEAAHAALRIGQDLSGRKFPLAIALHALAELALDASPLYGKIHDAHAEALE